MDTTEQEIRIDANKYENLLGILNSPDKENSTVALVTLENMDFQLNKAAIVMLKKQSKLSHEAWKENAPKIYSSFISLGLDPTKVVSYRTILDTFVKEKITPDDMETFYFKMFGKYMLQEMHDLGYTFLEEVNIKLKSTK